MTWVVEHVPADDQNSVLHTAAAGHGTAWAFGIGVHGDPLHTLVFRRDEPGWRRIDVPVIGRANRAITLGPDEVWIVGDGTSMHGVGDDWREVPTDSETQFFGLVAFGSEMWSAGYAAGRGTGAVQRWTGTEWTDQELPQVAPMWSLSGLGGVAADDLWAVGAVHATDGPPVALHRDGAKWVSVPVPLPGNGDGRLNDVWALASDDVWASGYWRRAGERGRLPLLVRWDGTTWSTTEVPAGTAQVRQLITTEDGLCAIGSADDHTCVLRWDGAAWQPVPGPPTPAGAERCSLHGAAVLPDGRLLVVGASGITSSDSAPYAAVQEL
ncbi:MAG TPA: hypothetical protein VGL80_13330 [Pseudonocardiaceae bacterium]|jgi:hypothetical protein